ncbi:MAG: hypothetical protein AB2794_12490 [Candidatus Thiodiazotropha endolucinida]
MQKFKIEHFDKDNPTLEFPNYRSLNNEELINVQENLISGFNVNTDRDLLRLVKAIDSLEIDIDDINADDDDFNLQKIFDFIKIKPTEYIYINWYRYDDIDSMMLSDFSNYFHDIWYQGSDDIDIFDETFSWIVSVRHDGAMRYTKNTTS